MKWIKNSLLLFLLSSLTGKVPAAELPTKKILTLDAAKQVAAAAEAEAKRRGSTVVIVVVDDGGHVLLLERLDDTQVASKDFEDQVRNGRVAALALPGATPLQGGIPIVVDGKVLGAIGVSGNTPQEDEDIAKVGAAAIATLSLFRGGSQ